MIISMGVYISVQVLLVCGGLLDLAPLRHRLCRVDEQESKLTSDNLHCPTVWDGVLEADQWS